MGIVDYFQVVNVLIITVTLIILVWQAIIQNRVSKAQLLRDRFEMYWQLWQPVSDEQVAEFQMIPAEAIDMEIYETKYKNDAPAIRKYIILAQIYEYLAFLHTLKEMGIEDPLGEHWEDTYIMDLLNFPEFLDVHKSYYDFYPPFARSVDQLITKRPRQ